MSLEKFLGRKIRSQSFIADSLDIPHLNVFVTRSPVIRPDYTPCTGFAPIERYPRTFRSNHFMHSKPADLLAIAQRQFYVPAPGDALKEPFEDASGI